MRAFRITLLIAAAAAVTMAADNCLSIRGDWIMANDLAAAIPDFGRATGRTLSVTPLAGAQRRFSRADLRRLARGFGLSDEGSGDWPDSVCFAYSLAPLSKQSVIEAIRRSASSEVAFELTEFSLFPVPPGNIEFKNVAFRPDRPDGSKLLIGRVEYGRGRRVPIWARVRSLSKPTGLVAVAELRPGVRLQAEHVRVGTLEIGAGNYLTATSQIEGFTVRRKVAVGTPLTANLLVRRSEVTAGETILISVRSGSAQLSFESRAETGGSAGELILLKNPDSGQRFRARVEGPARASLQLSPKENSCCQSSR